MDSTENNYLEQLISLYHSGKFEEVTLYAKDFLSRHEKNGTAWNLLALAHQQLGNVNESKRILEWLLSQKPDNPIWLNNLGNTLHSLGHLQNATLYFKRAIQIEPLLFESIKGLGLVYLDSGDFQQALKCFTRLLLIDKYNPKAIFNLANTYRKLRRFEDAAQYFAMTNFGLSKSHQLECLYYLNQKPDFVEAYHQLADKNTINPLVGCLGKHASIRFQEPFANLFCSDPLNHIYHSSVIQENGSNKNWIAKIFNSVSDNNSNLRNQPLLINGKQSSENVFHSTLTEIGEIEKIVRQHIFLYKKQFAFSIEPFIQKWPSDFELNGWTVTIKSGGSLKPHIHKEGWVSGSLYLNIPKKSHSNSGNIVFSLHGAGYPTGDQSYPETILEVSSGDICIFPSSLFHYTVPFEAEEDRITLAFDLIPVSR